MSDSGATEGVSSDWQLDPVLVSGALTGGKSALNFARQAGKAGEDAFAEQFPGFVRNTQKFATKFGNVIPDFGNEQAVVEVRNTKYHPLTKQLKGEVEVAPQQGKQFVLAVREGYTRLTSNLTKYIQDAGGAIAYYALKAADAMKDVAGKIGSRSFPRSCWTLPNSANSGIHLALQGRHSGARSCP
jgi:hypothetical protein